MIATARRRDEYFLDHPWRAPSGPSPSPPGLLDCRPGDIASGMTLQAGSDIDAVSLHCDDPSGMVPGVGYQAKVEAPMDYGDQAAENKLKQQVGKTGTEFRSTDVPIVPKAATSAPALPAELRYDEPSTRAGRRLYAGLRTDDDDTCGRPTADAFCQEQRFARAASFDTDKKKVQAQTLDLTQTCTKKRCRTFDYIVCVM